MKNWISLLFFGVSTLFIAYAQPSVTGLTFTFANEEVVNGNFEFEVHLQASQAGTFFVLGTVYFDYNTAAFGPNIVAEGNITVTRLALSPPTQYAIVNTADNSSSTAAITWQSRFQDEAPDPIFHTEVPTSPMPLMRISIPIVDNTELAGISFNSLMDGEQFGIVAANTNEAYISPNTYANNLLGAVLPLDLLSFHANAQAKSVKLDWTSANEVDFAGYELQRSTDGRAFQKLAWIDGAGQAFNTYSYLDEAVQAGRTYYYRLEMQDFDGTTTYSAVRTARLPLCVEEGKLLVQPNPAKGKFYVQFGLSTPAAVQLELYAPNGQRVYAQAYNLNEGENQLLVNTSPYPAGLYTAIIRAGEQEWSSQVVIER